MQVMLSPGQFDTGPFSQLCKLAAKWLAPAFKGHVVNSRSTLSIQIGPQEALRD